MERFFSIEKLTELTQRTYNSPSKLANYDKRVTGQLREFEAFVISAALRPRSSILDIGCGPGREAIALAKLGHQVVGIDFSEGMIKRAKLNARKLRQNAPIFTCGDVLKIVLHSKFDCILMINQVLSHIPSREGRLRLIKKLRDHIRQQGTVIIESKILDFSLREKAGQKILDLLNALTGLEEGDSVIDGTYFHKFTIQELKQLVSQGGFRSLVIGPDTVSTAWLICHPV